MKKMVLCLCVLMSGSVGNAVAACSGKNCEGKDPMAQGCGNDAVTHARCDTVDYNGRKIGQIELRWSEKCQTNWARTESYSNYKGVTATVRRKSYKKQLVLFKLTV